MFTYSNLLRRLAALGLATLGLTASASTAQATVQTATQNYQCRFPIVGVQPVSFTIGVDVPDRVVEQVATPPISVTVATAVGGEMATRLELIEDLASFEGIATATLSLRSASGSVTPLSVPIPIPQVPLTFPAPDPLAFTGAVQVPPLSFDEPGAASVTMDQLSLVLVVRDSEGSPIQVAPGIAPDIEDPNGLPQQRFRVDCKLNTGESPTLARVQVLESVVCICLPWQILPAEIGARSVKLTWPALDSEPPIVAYNVFQNGVKVASVSGTSATVSGLTPETTYEFSVEAIDDLGLSVKRANVRLRTGSELEPLPSKISTELRGSATLKTLVKGSLPLRGRLDAQVSPSGEITGDLSLNDALGRLTALGFLPVTAKFGFVPSGKLTGQYVGEGLTTKALMRIKVKEVKLFGAIPLAGGNSCQTKQLTELNLSGQFFTIDAPLGNGLSGTFAMSDLNGCGVLNGLVSPFTAGGGNTMWLGQWPVPLPSA